MFNSIIQKFAEASSHQIVLNQSDYSEHLDMFLQQYPQLKTIFDVDVSTFKKTQYHNENLYDHLCACGALAGQAAQILYDRCDIIRTVYTLDEYVHDSQMTGLFHDIGKPLARIDYKKHSVYTGHAQLGARIVEEIGFSEEQVWAIDHHMCYCMHRHLDNNFCEHHSSKSLMLDVPQNHVRAFALLASLAFADLFARDDKTFDFDFEKTIQYSINMITNLTKMHTERLFTGNQKYFLHMCGVSGSGKSHFANLLLNAYHHDYDIHIVSRDNAMLDTFREITETDPALVDYKTAYAAIADHKDIVQKKWVDMLDFYFTQHSTKRQIVIIDTVQFLYKQSWENTIYALSEEAREEYSNSFKCAFLSIPYKYFNKEYYMKMDSSLPLNMTGNWPRCSNETEYVGNEFSYITGSYGQLCQFFSNVLNKPLKIDTNIIQKSLDVLLNELHVSGDGFKTTCDKFIEMNNYKFMTYKAERHNEKEIQDKESVLIVFSYTDGMQQYNAKTRDYRGEGIIFVKSLQKFFTVRPGLPVFAEMATAHKDLNFLPYIVDDFAKIFDENHSIFQYQQYIKKKSVSKYILTPKFDGSLFNLTFINCSHVLFPYISNLVKIGKIDTVRFTPEGLFMIGSKGTCCCNNPVRQRILNSIAGSYPNIDEFFEQALNVICEKMTSNSQIITIHFEAIDKNPTPELTVLYESNKSVFLGLTLFDSNTSEKSFHLPSDCLPFIDSSPTFMCDTFDEVQAKYNEYYEMLFDEKNVFFAEPEGWVLHIIGDDNKIHSIKYKFDLYYVAHKPTSIRNKAKAQEIISSDKYKFFKARCLKFAEKKTFKMFAESINFVKKLEQLIVKVIADKNFTEYTKRNLVFFCNDNKDVFMNLFAELAPYNSEMYREWTKVNSLLFAIFDTQTNTLKSIDFDPTGCRLIAV